MKRCVFNHRDVGDRRATRDRPFEQVVAEHFAVGQTPRQHNMHHPHMQQPLAGKSALAKQILVNLGGGGAVRVNATLPGKQPVVEREILGRRQGCGNARLENAIAAHHDAGT